MAEKKALIILAPSAEISGGEGTGKLLKKGALLKNYSAGSVINTSVDKAEITAVTADGLAASVEAGAALMVLDLGPADTAAMEAALVKVMDAVDRKTVVALAGKNGLVLYGQGIDPKVGEIARPAKAEDVLPTLAAIGEFKLTAEASGAVIYPALKSPNAKLDEIEKLKEALKRMEGALARDNREPWDKHDCA